MQFLSKDIGLNLVLITVALISPSIAYRSQYHYPPADCERPKNNLEVVYQWKQLGFSDFSSITPDIAFDGRPNTTFIPYNNVPLGIAPYNDERLFIGVARRSPGIASTLNYINLNAVSANQSPLLHSYPDVETNRLDISSPSPDRIVSVYRPRVDYACNRLWFVDTGMLEYGDRVQVQRPSIWIIDLATGQRINRFEIPVRASAMGNGLASITIDVEPDRCDEAFAYIPDFTNYRLHVYSLAANRMWTFAHNYFYLDPLYGDFNVAGQRYQWRDGIFSVTLGPYQADGSREAYFHAMASLNEYVVSTRVLKNATNAARSFHGEDFTYIGRRQELGQSNMHAFDETTGVVFYNQVSLNAVGCYNTGEKFSAENHDLVLKDDLQMVYPSDLTMDNKGNVWVLSNRMPEYVYARLNENAYNFKIWKGKASEIIKGTKCE